MDPSLLPNGLWIAALTGGIASGKSTVSDRLAQLGVCIVDTDLLARTVSGPGSEGLAAIVTAFGETVLQADGKLDRARLRQRVFADPAARAQLEAITHPRIRAQALAHLRRCDAPYAVVVVPLLFEHFQAYRWVDRVVVVDVSRQTQRQRLLARDGISPELVEAMLQAQASRSERLSIADEVISNEGDLPALLAAVDALHQRCLSAARAKHDLRAQTAE